jgi:hypothetical protein
MRLTLRILRFDVDHPETGLSSFVHGVIEVLGMLDPFDFQPSRARQFANDMAMHLTHQLDDTESNVTGQKDSSLLPVNASHLNLHFAIKTRLGSEREFASARRRHVFIHGRPALPSGNGGNGGSSSHGLGSSHPPTSPGPHSNSSHTPNTGFGVFPSSPLPKVERVPAVHAAKATRAMAPLPHPLLAPTARALRRTTFLPNPVLFVVCTLKTILITTSEMASLSLVARSTLSSAAWALSRPHLIFRTSCYRIPIPHVLSSSSDCKSILL